jgi:hypothetical protein
VIERLVPVELKRKFPDTFSTYCLPIFSLLFMTTWLGELSHLTTF